MQFTEAAPILEHLTKFLELYSPQAKSEPTVLTQ